MPCSYPKCPKPIFVKRTPLGPLCNGHYKQYKQKVKEHPVSYNSTVSSLRPLRRYTPQKRKEISLEDKCPGPSHIEGEMCGRPKWGTYEFCQSHQRQLWNKEELKPIRDYTFQFEGDDYLKCYNCDTNPARAKGLCLSCYSKMRNKLKKEEK